MVSTYVTRVKMLQNTVHHGLIPRKVTINDKDDYKTVTKKHHSHGLISVITFLLEFTIMHAIQKSATEKILVKGLQISEHMLLCMM